MADVNKGQLYATAWQDYVKKEPTEQIFQYFWLLEQMRQGGGFKKGSGTPITGTIEYQMNLTVKDISALETLDVTPTDTFDVYEYQWKLKAGLFTMSEFEKAVFADGGQKFTVNAAKMENLKNTMFKQLNDDLYSDGTGTAGKQIGGVSLLVPNDPTTGTRGGISAATYTFWRSQQTSGAKSSTAYDNLRGAMRSMYNLCSSGVGMQNPEFGVTDRTTFEGYESLLVANERLVRGSKTDTAMTGYKGDHIAFKDISIAYDSAATSAQMYILNRRNLFLRYLLWMKAFPASSANNQFVDVVKILNIAQLCTDNPRRLGVITAIT